ncbi:MAG: GAF domain-containing protein [Pyrinomonadaceae bacterium]
MPKENEKKLKEKLREVFETIDVANALTEPLTTSIKNLLELSAAAIKSEEASVIVRNGDEGDMIFLLATGKVADRLTGIKIPAGKGIAGFVFSSGQPMAVADAGREKTFYPEVDRQTGYETRTILATPLRYNDEIIGVLEYVNRVGEPPFEPFTPDEMDKAALFADAISSLVNAFESATLLQEFGGKLLTTENAADFAEVRNWLQEIRGNNDYREMIDLAILVREIAGRGAAERALCREILEAAARYSKNNSETSFLNF